MIYQSFNEKKRFYPGSHCINEVNDFDNLYRKLERNKNLIFRGMNESKYKLLTSLQRNFLCGKINNTKYNQKQFMYEEVDRLKNSILSSYYKSLGVPVNDYLYMSFLQHYESPTSLMDFTEDIDVSLYFASRDPNYERGVVEENDILNYVSLYWINVSAGDGLQPIYKSVLKCFFEGIDALLFKEISCKEIESLINYCLSVDYLSTLQIGVIRGHNASRYKRLFLEEPWYKEMNHTILTFMKTRSRSAYNAIVNSVEFLFKKAIVIANLNQVEQRGCFIHYMPEMIKMPLEEFAFKDANGRFIINCVNIHKSLCPYIQHRIATKNINTGTLFPQPKIISLEAYQDAMSSIL